jgi:hypothetical protein
MAFAVIVFLTAWYVPDCRSPHQSVSISGGSGGRLSDQRHRGRSMTVALGFLIFVFGAAVGAVAGFVGGFRFADYLNDRQQKDRQP